ncbi:iduronate 2-sulfatase-like [Haliotis rubra]|uniref:iduronate 2-sulfatase-like n=1 Tax=Haliotis rubra TaxID=36100 RepID=UPI001EE534BE|nr:iduronate 2-sulfatase-like [Haliotis rubra]
MYFRYSSRSMVKLWVLLCLGIVHARKNVLFLVSDDMRPNIGAYDGPDYPSPVHPKMHTPNLDALAARSLLLKRAYVSVALCSPSRTALLTSRRPETSHIWCIGPYFRQYGGNFTTLPEYFKQNGYRTIGMGKIFHPGSSSGGDDPVSWTDPYTHADDDYIKADNVLIEAVSEERAKARPLQDQLLAEYAIQAIKEVAPKGKSGEKPFFLAVGFRKPHITWNFPARFKEYYPLESLRLPPNYYAPVGIPEIAWHSFVNLTIFKDMQPYHVADTGHINFTFPDQITLEMRQAYYSCISYIDYELGRVIAELDNQGLTNNTIISFWGDHGWHLGENGEWEKMTNFEAATHAPMMIHVPGVTDHGVVTEKITEFVDLYPTLVEAAGLPKLDMCPPNSQNVSLCTEGTSMVPLMTNPTLDDWKNVAFSEYSRVGNGIETDSVIGYSMRTEEYRYTEWVNFTAMPIYKPLWDQQLGAELYDHMKDPEENYNRVDDPAYKDLRVELSRNLRLGWRGVIPHRRV